jgi:hypothetical protein
MFRSLKADCVSEPSGRLLKSDRVGAAVFSVLSPARHASRYAEGIGIDAHAAVVASENVLVVVKGHERIVPHASRRC